MKEENTNKKFLESHPPQNYFAFGSVKLDSRFDSGNLGRVSNPEYHVFDIWISPDGLPYPVLNGYRVWFYFSVSGVDEGTTMTFNFRNINNESRLLSFGFRPVYKTPDRPWRKLPVPVTYHYSDKDGFQFRHTFNETPKEGLTYFAFSYQQKGITDSRC